MTTYIDYTNRNENGEPECEVCGTTEGNVDNIEYLDGDRYITTYTLCESDYCADNTDKVDSRRADARAEAYYDDYCRY